MSDKNKSFLIWKKDIDYKEWADDMKEAMPLIDECEHLLTEEQRKTAESIYNSVKQEEYIVSVAGSKELDEIRKRLEEDRQEYAERMNDEYLMDERINLKRTLDTDIYAIGESRVWNGTRPMAFHIHPNEEVLIAPSWSMDVASFTVNNDHGKFELEGNFTHHDGNAFLIYRKEKEGLSQLQKDRLDGAMEAYILGEKDFAETLKSLNKYTVALGPEIAKVYGWKLENKRVRAVKPIEIEEPEKDTGKPLSGR